jgi:putative ABC transport system permease protein
VTTLLTVFAAVALTLAAVGIYGVISYAITQRTRELGVRLALGAQRRDVLGLVLRRGLVLVACGLGVGIPGSLALTHLLSDFLFGVTPTDPTTFVVVSIFLGAIATLAAYIPALRATRIDPIIALRAQ